MIGALVGAAIQSKMGGGGAGGGAAGGGGMGLAYSDTSSVSIGHNFGQKNNNFYGMTRDLPDFVKSAMGGGSKIVPAQNSVVSDDNLLIMGAAALVVVLIVVVIKKG